MATVRRRCPECRRQFRVQNKSPRKFCEGCRPPRLKPLPEPPAPPVRPDVHGEIERTVRGQLEAASRMGTLPGVLACRVARRLDDGTLTTAQEPGYMRQLRELMREALDGVRPAADFVDDLAARRRA